jgi:hypothetical protein
VVVYRHNSKHLQKRRAIAMAIFGKQVSEYVKFQKGILWLIVIVALGRLGLSLAGVPNSTVKWLSVTAVAVLGLIYYGIRVHTTGFGSYKHLLPLLTIQNLLAHGLVALAIVAAIFTGRDNIYSAPEFSGGTDGKNWTHVGAHLVLGVVANTLLSWLVASGILFITKKLGGGSKGQELPKSNNRAAAAGA